MNLYSNDLINDMLCSHAVNIVVYKLTITSFVITLCGSCC